MASTPTGHDIDIEAQQNLSQPCGVAGDVGGSETHEMNALPGQSDTRPNDSDNRPLSGSTNRDPDPVSAISQDDGNGTTDQISVHQAEEGGAIGHPPTQAGHDESQAEAQTRAELPRSQVLDEQPANTTPGNNSGREPEEKRMIGDFDGSANALWTLYRKEAQSRDAAQIQTLKDDMDGVLIFAGLFSAALTAFVIDSKQNLKVSPTDQMIYYLQQNVAMLDQISHQIASISPQVSIPSTLPPSFPSFKPLSSDIRVNVFWFMALIFSLTAALLATLVQQWVRNYMHVFHQFSDSLKSARLRQYLHDGLEGWHMPLIAEAVPALLHVSLFLFFMGLCDFVLNINTTVGLSTTIPIGITGLVYILTIFAPVIDPQSPYQNSFSRLFWYPIQKLGYRRYEDRDSRGELVSRTVSLDIAEGQMQLATEETENRMGRDERAIRWLVSNMTEDAEMGEFVIAIPGSFDTEWGEEVWKKVSNTIEDEDNGGSRNELVVGTATDTNAPDSMPLIVRPSRIQSVLHPIIRLVKTCTPNDFRADLVPPPPARQPNVHRHSDTALLRQDIIPELTARVAHLWETCMYRDLFASDELWRRRRRACVETTACLVFVAGADLRQFGEISWLLCDIGRDQKTRESPLVGKGGLFVTRWTCLSLVVIRPILESNEWIRTKAQSAYETMLERAYHNRNGNEQALARVQKAIETFDEALRDLTASSSELRPGESQIKEQVIEMLQNHESQISELASIDIDDFDLRSVDDSISYVQGHMGLYTHGIINRHLPGVKFDDFDTEPVDFSTLVELFRYPRSFQFIFPRRNLDRIRTVARTFKDILAGQWDDRVDAFREILKNLREFLGTPHWEEDNPLHRQVWRLQDLSAGGFGFTVELFFLAFRQLRFFSSSSPNESHMFIATFRAITSDWRKYKHSAGTKKLLLHLLLSDRGGNSIIYEPPFIVNEFLVLLDNIFEGRRGEDIEEVVQQVIRAAPEYEYKGDPYWALFKKALNIITREPTSYS